MQTTLESAIESVTGERVTVTGSGRTDAGAHAFGQVIAFSTVSRLPTETLRRAINATLPFDIAVTEAIDVPASFHPRHDARSRTYRYLIWNRPTRSPFWNHRAAHVKPRLDEVLMDMALRLLEGERDLGAFVPVQTQGGRERTIYRARCTRRGDLIAIDLEATGFMRQMVRAIAGTAIAVGRGAVDLETFGGIVESADRTLAGDTAPAYGLYLLHVNYESPSDAKVLTIASPGVVVSEEN